MVKEELKKEAEENAKKFFGKPTDLVDLDNLRIFKNGYFAGAEPREKRIAELEKENKALREDWEIQKSTIKDLEELNKKNINLDQAVEIERLKGELQQDKKVQVVEHFEAYGQCRDSRRIAGLETQNKWLEDCKSELVEHLGKANDKVAELERQYRICEGNADTYYDQLAQAKGYFSRLRKIFYNGESSEKRLVKIRELLEEAEQFLKEIEK